MRKCGIILAGVALLTLVACGKGGNAPATGPQTKEEVAQEVSKVKLEPGQWEYTQEIQEAKFDNAPKGMPPGMMQAMIGKKTSFKHCITPEEAENPGAEMMSGKKDKSCKYANFDMSGGTISGTMSCTGEDGRGTMTMQIAGAFTSTSYDTMVDMTMAGMGNMTMHMKAKGSGRRLGECPAGAKG